MPEYRISRNGTELIFVEQEIKRGDNKGKFFFSPQVSDLNQLVNFLGAETTLDTLMAKVRQWCQAWTGEATSDDGTFSSEDFIKMVEGLSARGESIKVLQAKIVELAEQFGSLDVSKPEDLLKAASIAKRIKAIKEDMASKRRKTADDIAAEQEGTN